MKQLLQVLVSIEDLNHVSKLSIVVSPKDKSISNQFSNVNCQLLQSFLVIDFQLSSKSDNYSSNHTTYQCFIPLPNKQYNCSSIQVHISDYITCNISYSNDNNTALQSILQNSNENTSIDNNNNRISIECVKCHSCLSNDDLTSIQELPSGELDMVSYIDYNYTPYLQHTILSLYITYDYIHLL